MKVIPKLREHNVHVVAVSLGSSQQAAEFMKRTGFKGELYVDSSSEINLQKAAEAGSKVAKTYRALRLKRGPNMVSDPRSQKRANEVTNTGIKDWKLVEKPDETIWPGDFFQVGGVFVLGAGNVCDYAFRSQYAGDHPPIKEVMVAATGQAADGEDYVYPVTQAWVDKLDLTHKSVAVPSKPPTISEESEAASQQYGLPSLVAAIFAVFAALIAVVAQLKVSGHMDMGADLHVLLIAGAAAAATTAVAAVYAIFSRNTIYPDVAPACPAGGASVGQVCLPCPGRELPEPTLLTAKDVDLKVLQEGSVECDCGAVVSALPFLDADPAKEGRVGASDQRKRQRGDTWDGAMGENEFQTILCYIRNFLGKAHPAVGRAGPVCPFVPKALRKNSLYLGVVRFPQEEKQKVTQQQMATLVKKYADKFEKLEPTTGRARQFKAIVLIFPDVALADAPTLIDGVQRLCKPDFVARGLMVGEFHLRNNAPGLRNDKFYPLRTPIPCLAMRHMVPTDLAFLNVDDYEEPLRLKFLRSFLDVFGGDKRAMKQKEIKLAQEALNKLETKMRA